MKRFSTRNNYSGRRFAPRNGSRNGSRGGFATQQMGRRDLMDAVYASKSQATIAEATPEEVYIPKNSFADFEIAEALKKNITAKQYTTPTPIQDQTIIPMLEGRDVIGIAATGTGKTAAFLIPLINKVIKNKDEKVLIVAPTRELAVQIQDELKGFTRGMQIFSALCIGGASMYRQRSDLRYHNNFVIGTPGRIKDHIKAANLHLSDFHSVVLDEADRMVDIGFIGDIKLFISMLPKDRQSLFFSATISGKVKEILDAFVQNPVTVSVERKESHENIVQDVIQVNDRDKKIEQLHDLLIQKEFNKVLIFGRTKWGIQKLSDELVKRGFKAGAIHGNKRQNQRQHVLDQFKRDQLQVLLATDVASRGIDIPDVSHVINYDMPASYDDYIHRIGRTGRASKKGIALTFVD